MPNKLQLDETMKLTVNLDAALTSGTYTVILKSEKGGQITSPSFTVP